MKLIEMIVTVGEDGVLQLPKAEVDVMGLKPGDEICLSYFAESIEKRKNRSGEFLLEKIVLITIIILTRVFNFYY